MVKAANKVRSTYLTFYNPNIREAGPVLPWGTRQAQSEQVMKSEFVPTAQGTSGWGIRGRGWTTVQ